MAGGDIDGVALFLATEAARDCVDYGTSGDYGYGGEIFEREVVDNWTELAATTIVKYLASVGRSATAGSRVAGPCCGCSCGRCQDGHETGPRLHTDGCRAWFAAEVANSVPANVKPLDEVPHGWCTCPKRFVGANSYAFDWTSSCYGHGLHSEQYNSAFEIARRAQAESDGQAAAAADEALRVEGERRSQIEAAVEAARARGRRLIVCVRCGDRTRPWRSNCPSCGATTTDLANETPDPFV